MTCTNCGHSADRHDFTAMLDEDTGDLVFIEAEERYITADEVDTPCFHVGCTCVSYKEAEEDDLAIPVKDLII